MCDSRSADRSFPVPPQILLQDRPDTSSPGHPPACQAQSTAVTELDSWQTKRRRLSQAFNDPAANPTTSSSVFTGNSSAFATRDLRESFLHHDSHRQKGTMAAQAESPATGSFFEMSGLSYLMALASPPLTQSASNGGTRPSSATSSSTRSVSIGNADYFSQLASKLAGQAHSYQQPQQLAGPEAPSYPFSLPKFGISSPQLAPQSGSSTADLASGNHSNAYLPQGAAVPFDYHAVSQPQAQATLLAAQAGQAHPRVPAPASAPVYQLPGQETPAQQYQQTRPSLYPFPSSFESLPHTSSSSSSLKSGGSFAFSPSSTSSPGSGTSYSSHVPLPSSYFSTSSLALSPHQTLLMQEAHKEASQRQAGLFYRTFASASSSNSPLPPVEEINWTEYALDLGNDDLTLALRALESSAQTMDDSYLAVTDSQGATEPSPSLGSHGDSLSPFYGEHDIISVDSLADDATPKKTSPPSGSGAASRHSPRTAAAGRPPASSSSTASGRSIPPASVLSRNRQLANLPADEAFASSLDQLDSGRPGEKPQYLWWTLIRAAILGSPEGKMQMETLCAEISEKFPYFGTAKEAKNWKSSIRSVIHTKPCFYKTEDRNGGVWWHVDVSVDPREQRRGMKKRASMSSGAGHSERGRRGRRDSTTSGSSAANDDDEVIEEEDAEADTDDEALEMRPSASSTRKRRKTNER